LQKKAVMKILILGTAYPLRGGIAHYIGLLAQHLGKSHDVQVITFKRQYPAFLFPGKTQRETGDPGIAVKSEVMIDSVNPFNWIRVGLLLRDREADLIIFKYWLPFFGPCFGTICRLLKWKRRTRVVAICDNVIPHERRPGDRLLTRYAFAPVDAFIVQSDAVERDLLSFVPQATYRNVPHPVYEIFGEASSKNDARRKLGIRDERVALFFGYVRAYKGLHVLIDAMKLVKKSLSVKLFVVGEFYDDVRRYRDHLVEAGVSDVVEVVPDYVPNESVSEYFSAADVVILPYLSATQSGIAQIAYNFQKPVIATRVGGLAEVVVENVSGLLVPSNDPPALAAAILRFYNDGLENAMVQGAAAEKKKYTWEAMVHAIEELAMQ
jgi:glycosyltransferase involved in cell wall biosynthesis